MELRSSQNTHCIGDRANKVVLNIYERLLTNGSDDPLSISNERRPRIEHAQIMRVEDLKRAGRLGGKLLGIGLNLSSY